MCRMLAEGTGGGGQGLGGPTTDHRGPGLHAVGHRECGDQEKSTQCTLRPDGAGLRLRGQRGGGPSERGVRPGVPEASAQPLLGSQGSGLER